MTMLPFAGQIVRSERALDVTSPAYDALSVQQRRQFRVDNPLSYLHVTRSAIDELDAATVDNATLVARGRTALDELIHADVFAPAEPPAFYVYGLSLDGHVQLGLVGEYAGDTFARLGLPHEGVSSARVQLLAEHFLTVGAASSPVAAAVRDDGGLQLDLEQVARTLPVLDFTAADGLHQQVWRVTDPVISERLARRLAEQPVYIVDGHHRAGANRYLLDQGQPTNLLVCVFPAAALQTLGFNRLVTPSHAMSAEDFAAHIRRRFPLTPVPEADLAGLEPQQGRVLVFLNHAWHTIELDERPTAGGPGIRLGSLDPTVVDREILRGLKDKIQVSFAPNDSDLTAVARSATGDGVIPLVLAPVEIDDLLAVADGHLTMPEKSTYFSPKVRSGLFLRRYDHS